MRTGNKLIKVALFRGFFTACFFTFLPPAVNGQSGVYSTAVVNMDPEGGYTQQEFLSIQLQATSRALDDISEVFTSFSEADIEANRAMEKVDLIGHEYEKSLMDVPEEGQALHDLMKALLSHAENYLAYFKRFNRENPEINARIIQIKREVNQEMVRLHYLTE